jgi:hypothetical protein
MNTHSTIQTFNSVCADSKEGLLLGDVNLRETGKFEKKGENNTESEM